MSKIARLPIYERMKLLQEENAELKELAKKNNDWNIVQANLAQRQTIKILKGQLEERDQRLEKAIAISNSTYFDDIKLQMMKVVLEAKPEGSD